MCTHMNSGADVARHQSILTTLWEYPWSYMRPRIDPATRFFRHVAVDLQTHCWHWTGAINKLTFHGEFWDGEKRVKAHRWSFQHHFGYLPEVVRHKCDLARCVNPTHLEPGDQADNVADCIARDRKHTKLFWKQVLRIREEAEHGVPRAKLALDYGVSEKQITRILRGDSWRTA